MRKLTILGMNRNMMQKDSKGYGEAALQTNNSEQMTDRLDAYLRLCTEVGPLWILTLTRRKDNTAVCQNLDTIGNSSANFL
jgi:hypothetical protein